MAIDSSLWKQTNNHSYRRMEGNKVEHRSSNSSRSLINFVQIIVYKAKNATTSIIQTARCAVKLSFCDRWFLVSGLDFFPSLVFMCWILWLVSFSDESEEGIKWANRRGGEDVVSVESFSSVKLALRSAEVVSQKRIAERHLNNIFKVSKD